MRLRPQRPRNLLGGNSSLISAKLLSISFKSLQSSLLIGVYTRMMLMESKTVVSQLTSDWRAV